MLSHRWGGLAARLVVAVSVACVAGCGSDEDETNGAAPGEAEATSAGDPELTVTATELADAFKEDEDAAGQQYGDKVIRVTGVLGLHLMTDAMGEKVIVFGRPLGHNNFEPIVSVYPAADQIPQAEELWRGQEITVVGKCVDPLFGIGFLQEGRFEEVGEPIPAIEIAAGDLIGEFQADVDAATERYMGKVVVVTGVAGDWDREEQKFEIRGDEESGEDPIRLQIEYGLVETDLIAALENYNPGDPIRVKAECRPLFGTRIGLSPARVLAGEGG